MNPRPEIPMAVSDKRIPSILIWLCPSKTMIATPRNPSPAPISGQRVGRSPISSHAMSISTPAETAIVVAAMLEGSI